MTLLSGNIGDRGKSDIYSLLTSGTAPEPNGVTGVLSAAESESSSGKTSPVGLLGEASWTETPPALSRFMVWDLVIAGVKSTLAKASEFSFRTAMSEASWKIRTRVKIPRSRKGLSGPVCSRIDLR